ncbi:MAG TPA: TRC40/GET3/ArsA family transport-energizing ATPase [Egibacteraceae bacterium]|nr:TRC40/GET3/ArsA family transport-energizing ATPase [Egibacteraceae bacterium]
MRVLLFTGKGGVGKTSVAAASALRAAAAGLRTLVVSTDPAHSLADALDVPLGDRPVSVAPRLDAEQIDAQARLEEHWRDIQGYLIGLLQWGGVGEIEAEELSVIPGLEEIFALVDVRDHVEAGNYDLLVVDCAPTAETLRLLSLPDALGWYMERVFPAGRTLARMSRPVLSRVTTMPLPQDKVLGSVEDLYRRLAGVRDILSDGSRSTVRLVVNAERMVIAEARRTMTALSLFGYSVDAVVVNRLIPATVTDPWFDRWKAIQAEHLAAVRDGFAGVPVLTAPLFDAEPIGAEALGRLAAELYGEQAVEAVLHEGTPLTFEREGEDWLLRLALPFADKADLDLFHRGAELTVKVGSHVRKVALPAALGRSDVAGAALRDGRLEVRFSPRAAQPQRAST